jgi:redox-sensing transcriptional repressor
LYLQAFRDFSFSLFPYETPRFLFGKAISILFIDIARSIDLAGPEWYNHSYNNGTFLPNSLVLYLHKTEDIMEQKNVSLQTLRRLPVYLHYLRTVQDQCVNISATAIADKLGLNDVQVRKDLASVSGSGRPKTGYNTLELLKQLETYLGCGSSSTTVLIGAGNLGKALMAYSGFDDYGLEIVAAFDRNPQLIGANIGGKPVYPMEKLGEFCRMHSIRVGIITVPATVAQTVCDELVSHGVRAIWNFAPTILRVPEGVQVENENLASSLAVLSQHWRKV